VLRKAVNKVEKWLKVPEVLIVKGAKGAEWVLKVLTGC
jgi:hypothetical protein